jgi:hypothetical protein
MTRTPLLHTLRNQYDWNIKSDMKNTIGLRRRVSKRVEDGHRPPALQAGHPRNGCEAVLGVVHPQRVEGAGMAGTGETLGSPWPSLICL